MNKFAALPNSRMREQNVERTTVFPWDSPGAAVQERDTALISEQTFTEMLGWERRRSERSGKCFLLTLLDVSNLGLNGHTTEAVRRVAAGVSEAMRDTDVTGWYREGRTIGMILTELGGADKSVVIERVRGRLVDALQDQLPPHVAERIRISFTFYPDDWTDGKPGNTREAFLFPDVTRRQESRKVALTIKRVMDVTGSLLALILFSPILIVAALLIKLTSKGPVLFRQRRVGQHGHTFDCLKFRTMDLESDSKVHQEFVTAFIKGQMGVSANGNGHGVVPAPFKLTQDPRVTPIGRMLRRASFDELPQFLNVLRGEMSIVGPRPPIPYELESYDAWHRRRLLEVKPGITGLWQVMGRSRTTFDEMVRLDLRYARAWSLWLDLKIILRTPLAMFSGKGAY